MSELSLYKVGEEYFLYKPWIPVGEPEFVCGVELRSSTMFLAEDVMKVSLAKDGKRYVSEEDHDLYVKVSEHPFYFGAQERPFHLQIQFKGMWYLVFSTEEEGCNAFPVDEIVLRSSSCEVIPVKTLHIPKTAEFMRYFELWD